MALAQALQRTLPVQVGLKWPNDLWWQGAQTGGILIETATMRTAAATATPRQAALAPLCGDRVGINLAHPPWRQPLLACLRPVCASKCQRWTRPRYWLC